MEKVQNEERAFINAYSFEKNFCDHRVLKNLIKILLHLVNSDQPNFACKLLSQVLSECYGFVMKLKEFILMCDNPLYLTYITKIGQFCISNIPGSTIFTFPCSELKEPISRVKDENLKKAYERLDAEFNEKRQAHFDQVRSQSSNSHASAEENEANDQEINEEPPENFRTLPILPDSKELQILDKKPFLRANRVRGGYHDWDHYLDVQFRLLREDFMGPLRDGIHKYLTETERSQDIRVYEGVKILSPVCLYDGIGFVLQFDILKSRLTRVNWAHSRRLIFGSLLCLSRDNFKTIHFASVVKREAEHLEQGQLIVKFEGDTKFNAFEIDPMVEFRMVESTAYFEAYRHILESLQQIKPDQMPFQNYIVARFDKGSQIPLPLCYRHHSRFDLNAILELKKAMQPIDVTNWPDLTHVHTCLDESQLAALKMALTQDLSIIQGPPGTGKTYIGLKIVQALLQNRHVWDPNKNSPILVVCYTNHALDQFLGEILKCKIAGNTPNVVRIGGRCKDEKIKECALANLVKTMRSQRKVPARLFRTWKDNRIAMKDLQTQMQKAMEYVDTLEGKILPLDVLYESKVVSDHHLQQLQFACSDSDRYIDKAIEVWLNLYFLPEVGDDVEMIEEKPLESALQVSQQEALVTAVGGLVIEDEGEAQLDEGEGQLIDVPDEPQLLQEERMLEGEEIEFEEMPTLPKSVRSPSSIGKDKKQSLDDEKWQVKQLSTKERKHRIKKGMTYQPMHQREALNVFDIWKLSPKNRWRLYQYWLNQYMRRFKSHFKKYGDLYDRCAIACQEIDYEINAAAITDADVVGMTTTGAAKHGYILKSIRPKVVIVEEAAEVLESHVVTSLSSSVQQLVLIGDHKQLQPKVTYYELEKNYNLQYSLFERLAINDVPIAKLHVQHRMRPEIADIVAHHIYDGLENHESVTKYESIRGISKNLYFMDHDHPEKNDDPSGDKRSHSNDFEADYIVALTRYLLKQAYKPTDITILTMYRGQLLEIKRKMKRAEFEGVRVAAVDDFQGEENDIVILSLVRSNENQSVGFLKIQNRVCVSLSRARKGMYIIGNLSMLRGKDKTVWPAILNEMESNGYVGRQLELCCQIHPQEKILAAMPQDFSKSPEGGCQKPCGYRFRCGHACQSPCHPIDREHKLMYRCQQICGQPLPCKHKCRQNCYKCENGCGPCTEKVQKYLPSCGHQIKIECSADVTSSKCQERCERRLPKCYHKCQNKCFEECTKLCKEIVTKQLPCGHKAPTECWKDVASVDCPVPCGKSMECGHDCKGTCGKCSMGRLHVACVKKCNRSLACGHICKFPCPSFCPPCTQKCQNYCYHSRCPKKCYEPCVPCREPCLWKCKHYKCTATCGEMCSRPPCNAPCDKVLPCGHPCIGLCGEECPKQCRICNKEEVSDIFFGTEDEENARFISLKDCGHIFEVIAMDQWMKQQQQENSSGKNYAIKFLECPRCKTAIRRSVRYGNIIKKTISDMEEVKKASVRSNINLRELKSKAEASLIKDCPMAHTLYSFICDILQNALSNSRAKPNVPPLLAHEASTIENLLALCPIIKKLYQCLEAISGKTIKFEHQEISAVSIEEMVKKLLNFLKAKYLTPQQIHNGECELRRLYCLSRICQVINTARNENKDKIISPDHGKQLETAVTICLTAGLTASPFTIDNEENISSLLNQIIGTYSIGGLSAKEKAEVVKIMQDNGVGKGAWYKCPQGHIYCIGECGGANQESKCPECGATIGGVNHALAAGNVHAGEMDGSQHAAWSQGANLANYDPDQLQRLFN